jgi:hypothetical protein
MIEINVNSVNYFLKNGYMGFKLNYKDIEPYDAHVSKVCNSPYPNENRIIDRNCWSYIVHGFEPITEMTMVYLLEFNNLKYGTINIPLNFFADRNCVFTVKLLNEKYIHQMKIIEFAQKYYKEKMTSVEFSVEFSFVADHDVIIGIESLNLAAEAYIDNNKINIEKAFRRDMENYLVEDFDINCPNNKKLIEMITE